MTFLHPTYGPVPPGPGGAAAVLPVNAEVVAVHTATGHTSCGFAQKVGGVWKFKAMGYDSAGRMEPGHGPLTEQHNMAFAARCGRGECTAAGGAGGESGAGLDG